jgi:hypothetical protein
MSWKRGNRLPVLPEAQAGDRVRQIYQELKESLGLPYVNVVFQVYAGFPKFIDLQWEMLRPVIKTQVFFDLAERIRADAYTRMHNYFEIPDLCDRMTGMNFSEGARQELTYTLDLIQYNDPLLLLMVVAQMQALEGPVGSPDTPRTAASPPKFDLRPVLVDEETAPSNIKKIFEDMKHTFNMPVVITDYRALARWPDFLQSFWGTLKPISESPLYHQCANGLREGSWNIARELPGPFELTVSTLEDAGVEEGDISSIVRLTDIFSRSLTSTVLNMAMAKIGLEGGNRGARKAQPSTEPTTASEEKPIRAA